MESGKLDIDSEVKTPKEPVATYKPIPEDDSVLAAKQLANEEVKMAKHDGDTDTDDGAQELMLKNTGKINSNKEASEVKFISENGDAKIDIETVKQALTGMTKEELMKFANDPFWIRLRWFMFLTFWLLWAAMLAGAIAIIVMAPKCAAPEPKKLWQRSAIVQLNPSAMNLTLKQLDATLDALQKQNIRVISLDSILQSSLEGHTTDFRNIKPELGNIEDFKELIKAAGKREQEIVLEIDPNHSSSEHVWFQKSIKSEKPYTDYYIWASGKPDNPGPILPPTNWLSVSGGSAWEANDVRKQYYLHQFGKNQPDLNFTNPDVVREFTNIFTDWMKLGVTGFRLANTQYLLENLGGGDEPYNTIPAPLESYKSLNHVHTRDLPENPRVLQTWRTVVSNYTKGNGLFSLKGDVSNDMLEVLNDQSIIDLPQKSHFLSTAYGNISASAILIGVNNSLPSIKEDKKPTPEKIKEDWPAWNLNDGEEPLSKRMNQFTAESLTLMTLMLPGTPILSLNQTQFPGEGFVALTKARDEPAFQHGKTKTYVNETAFVYTRLKSGNPGYLVVYESADNSTTLDLTQFDKVSEEVTIIALSSNYAEAGIAVKNRIPSNKVPLSPKSTMVVQFAPKTE